MPLSALSGAPAGYFIHRAARAEALAHALVAELRRAPPANPFEPVSIVVGSRGMERWLRHQIAMSEVGIAANLRFPFPAEALREAFALESSAGWQPAALAWTILGVLPTLLPSREFAAVRGWLSRSGAGGSATEPGGAPTTITRDQLALARELAEVIDRAALFRPEWIEAWEASRDAAPAMFPGPPAWQGALWRALRAAIAEAPPHQALANAKPRPGGALHVFAVSSMPPLWLSAWQRAGRARPMHGYMLSPTPHYWGDLRTRAELRRDSRAGEAELAQNPLLTALGRLARDTHDLVIELDPDDIDVPDAFTQPSAMEPLPGRLLHWLQDDMVEVRGGDELQARRASRTLDVDDDSVRVHACHGPTRQAEVLREALLELFERHPDLEPRHVLVMTPDVATYAPLVQAAFGEGYASRHLTSAEGQGHGGWGPVGAPRLPLAVADLGLRVLNPVADALLRVLELARGRLSASAALELFALDPVRRRFRVETEQIVEIRNWMARAGARWGADATERARHGNPPQHDFTFAFALDRIALGLVMADDDTTWAGVAPLDDMEGQSATVGKFMEFLSRLEHWRARLDRPLPLREWCARLVATLDELTETARGASFLRTEVLEGIAALEAEAGTPSRNHPPTLDAEALRALVTGRFEMGRAGDRPQSGAITLCALQPMRSVPFRVVALLGMNDGAFPRAPVGRGFDATLSAPRRGDRDPREEDRNLLLEAILSTREHLLVLYTGTDPLSGKPLAPAVPVGDLLDALEATASPWPGTATEGSARLRHQVTVRHAVQPFVASSFKGRRFDRRMAAAARALAAPRLPWPGILGGGRHHPELPDPEPPTALPLADLVRWTRQPFRMLARYRLGLPYEGTSEASLDEEPLSVEGLERWQFGELLSQRWMLGKRDIAVTELALRARAQLPPASPGRAALETHLATVAWAAELLPSGQTNERHPIRLDVGGVELVGGVETLGNEVVDFAIDAAGSPRRLLRIWVAMLALASTLGHPVRGRVIGMGPRRPTALTLATPTDPLGCLHQLLADWRRARLGTCLRLEKTSHAAAAAFLAADGNAAAAAEQAAWAAWSGGLRGGESADGGLRTLFGDTAPFADEAGALRPEFTADAIQLWKPILAAVETP